MLLNFIWLWLLSIIFFPVSLLLAIGTEGPRNLLKRALIFLLLSLVFILLNTLHLIGFLLDEILFPRYRSSQVKKPVFILGIPRSGTTHLHRVMAMDKQFTSLHTWEVLLAPSITERYVYQLLGLLLSPLSFIARKIRTLVFRSMDDVHLFGLLEPEEDFFLLAWVNHCFLMTFCCPTNSHYRKLGKFSTEFSVKHQQRIMSYYRMCLQKHIYFHEKKQGLPLRLLSKNPSFTSMVPALRNNFQDAQFIACHREPLKVIPSQLSSLKPALALLASGQLNPKAQQRLIVILQHYYEVLNGNLSSDGFMMFSMGALQKETENSVREIYKQLNMIIPSSFSKQLNTLNKESKQYKTKHQYCLEEFGLGDSDIEQLSILYENIVKHDKEIRSETTLQGSNH